MNGKKVNWAFLVSILLYISCSLLLSFVVPSAGNSIVVGNFLVEMIVLLPALLFAIGAKEKLPRFLGFHKTKLTVLLAVIPFTMFTTPFISLLNLLTQFFVKNAAADMMTTYKIAELPFVLVWFVIGLFAPICEEVACRGVYYRGYRRSGTALAAMLASSLLFGLMHMNLNQAVYAFGMGILSVLLVEAAGSLWASVLYHALINSSQVAVMYVSLKMNPEIYREASDMVNAHTLVYSVAVYLMLTAITLPLAWALLVWMSNASGRRGVLLSLFKKSEEKEEQEKKKSRVITIPLVIALVLCIGMIVLQFLI